MITRISRSPLRLPMEPTQCPALCRTFFTIPNGRVFDVLAEGALVLDNYDIFVQAGGQFTAKSETFDVVVADGELRLDFVSQSKNLPKVSAIEYGPVAP